MRVFEKRAAGLMVRASGGEIVIGRKHADPRCNGVYPNKWVLPGGIIHDGETPLEAALREARAEIGLDLSEYPAKLIEDEGNDKARVLLRSGEIIIYHLVQCSIFEIDTGTPMHQLPLRLNHEFASLVGVPIEDLPRYDHCPPSVELFRRLGYLPLAAAIG